MPDRDFELGQQIAELRGIVIEGFKGVHARQDITNGRVGKLESRMTDVENNQANSAGHDKGATASWQTVMTVASLIIALLALIFKLK